MLTKELKKLNISILENEKQKLENAIKHCEASNFKDSDYLKKTIEKHRKKIIKIDKIIEHFQEVCDE